MRSILIIVLFTYIYSQTTRAQSHTSWSNYSFSQKVTDISIIGNDVWVITQGGLVKYNKKTGEKTYYNRANANLPDNNLLGLFCNTNGDIWVSGKYYGIGKFNGEQCIIYNQSNSGLPFDRYNTKVKMDENNNVWIASFRWMVKYDGNNWKTWSTGSDFSAFPIISDFVIDGNGIVWLYSTDGFGKIENEEYSIVSTIGSGLIAKHGYVEVDSEQNIWIAIENEGLYKYDGSTFTNYSDANSCLPTNNIYAISFDSENNMWLASAEGLVNFNISDCIHHTPPISDKALLSVKCGKSDTIWCGSFSGNLLCFDGIEFTSIGLSNSPLKSNYVLDVLVDEMNNKWIGTKRNIVKKTSDQFYSVFNTQAHAFAQDKEGAVWIAFGSGDTCLLKTEVDEIVVFDSLNSPFNTKKISIRTIEVDNNNHLWISTSNSGLFKYDGFSFSNFNTINSAIPSDEILQLAFDNEYNLWGGSANGLFKFDGTDWTIWDTTNSAIPTNIVNSLAFDGANRLWFSCMDENRIVGIDFGGGLTYFDGQTMFTYKTGNSGLLVNTIFDIFIDNDDIIWLATFGAGLMSFDKGNKWISYNVTNSGIADNRVQRIEQDKSGNLWLGHIDAGISVFAPDSSIQTLNSFNANNSSFIIFPNPVSQVLNIDIIVPEETNVLLNIYDMSGRNVLSLSENIFGAGTIRTSIENLQSGFYLCEVIAGENISREQICVQH